MNFSLITSCFVIVLLSPGLKAGGLRLFLKQTTRVDVDPHVLWEAQVQVVRSVEPLYSNGRPVDWLLQNSNGTVIGGSGSPTGIPFQEALEACGWQDPLERLKPGLKAYPLDMDLRAEVIRIIGRRVGFYSTRSKESERHRVWMERFLEAWNPWLKDRGWLRATVSPLSYLPRLLSKQDARDLLEFTKPYLQDVTEGDIRSRASVRALEFCQWIDGLDNGTRAIRCMLAEPDERDIWDRPGVGRGVSLRSPWGNVSFEVQKYLQEATSDIEIERFEKFIRLGLFSSLRARQSLPANMRLGVYEQVWRDWVTPFLRVVWKPGCKVDLGDLIREWLELEPMQKLQERLRRLEGEGLKGITELTANPKSSRLVSIPEWRLYLGVRPESQISMSQFFLAFFQGKAFLMPTGEFELSPREIPWVIALGDARMASGQGIEALVMWCLDRHEEADRTLEPMKLISEIQRHMIEAWSLVEKGWISRAFFDRILNRYLKIWDTFIDGPDAVGGLALRYWATLPVLPVGLRAVIRETRLHHQLLELEARFPFSSDLRIIRLAHGCEGDSPNLPEELSQDDVLKRPLVTPGVVAMAVSLWVECQSREKLCKAWIQYGKINELDVLTRFCLIIANDNLDLLKQFLEALSDQQISNIQQELLMHGGHWLLESPNYRMVRQNRLKVPKGPEQQTLRPWSSLQIVSPP